MTGSAIQKLINGDTQTARRSRKPTLIFFEISSVNPNLIRCANHDVTHIFPPLTLSLVRIKT
jgi:hypothetical protein